MDQQFPVAPLIDNTSLPKPILLNTNDPASITVSITGNPRPIVRWQIGKKRVKDGSKYSITDDGRNKHTLEILKVSEELEAGVWVMATNDLGEDCCLLDVKINDGSSEMKKTKKSKDLTGMDSRRDSSSIRKKKVRKAGDLQSVTSLNTWQTSAPTEVPSVTDRGRMHSVDNLAIAEMEAPPMRGGARSSRRGPPPALDRSYDSAAFSYSSRRSRRRSASRDPGLSTTRDSESSLVHHDTSVDDIFMGVDRFAKPGDAKKATESTSSRRAKKHDTSATSLVYNTGEGPKEGVLSARPPVAHKGRTLTASQSSYQIDDPEFTAEAFVRSSVRSRKSARSKKRGPGGSGSRASSVSSVGTTAELAALQQGVPPGDLFGRGVVTSTPFSGSTETSRHDTSSDDIHVNQSGQATPTAEPSSAPVLETDFNSPPIRQTGRRSMRSKSKSKDRGVDGNFDGKSEENPENKENEPMVDLDQNIDVPAEIPKTKKKKTPEEPAQSQPDEAVVEEETSKPKKEESFI